MEVNDHKTRAQRKWCRRKLLEQKVIGIIMLVISAIFLWICSTTNEDCGAVLITTPLGILLLFSQQIWIM